jgi:hypothetical protein
MRGGAGKARMITAGMIFTGLATAATAVLVAASQVLPVQITIVLLGVMAAFVLHDRSRVLLFAVLMVPSLSFVRRVTAGSAGYTDSDPLILLPIALVVAVVVLSWTKPRTDSSQRFVRGAAVAVIAGTAVTLVLRGSFEVSSLFFAGLIVVPLMLAISLSTGRMPPVWDVVSSAIPALAVLAGTYGIIQFFFLPAWDRAWMITSRLTSIGAPLPMQVRVFGASESPGPYALFLGLAITLCLAKAVVEPRLLRRTAWVGVGAYILFPLLLSGVRSTLIGIVVSAVLLTLIRARGLTRLVFLAFLVGGYALLQAVVGRFGAGSSILTSDRYSGFSTQDDSFVARIDLLRSVGNPLSYIVGDPSAGNADNLYVSVLIRYGFVAAVALLALVTVLVVSAIRRLAAGHSETVALSVIFIAVNSLFGPIFDALFGIVIGVVFGTLMSVAREDVGEPSHASMEPGRVKTL